MDDVVDIINRYDIDYILYGTSERHKYGDLGEEKFADHLPVVCQHGRSRVYYSAPVIKAAAREICPPACLRKEDRPWKLRDN